MINPSYQEQDGHAQSNMEIVVMVTVYVGILGLITSMF